MTRGLHHLTLCLAVCATALIFIHTAHTTALAMPELLASATAEGPLP